MTVGEAIIGTLLIGGLSCFVFGLVFSNIAVYQMAQIWNQGRGEEERIAPWAVLGKGAKASDIVPKYRELTEDGPLYRQLKFSYWMLVGGISLAIVGFGIGYLSFGHGK